MPGPNDEDNLHNLTGEPADSPPPGEPATKRAPSRRQPWTPPPDQPEIDHEIYTGIKRHPDHNALVWAFVAIASTGLAWVTRKFARQIKRDGQ